MITKNWNNYLKSFPPEMQDVYFTEEYVKLYENEKDTAECFVYLADKKVFLFPYLKRQINLLQGEYYDFETPYGYGGPLSNTDDNSFMEDALESMKEEFIAGNFVCGFIRFHPLLENQTQVANSGFINTINDRKTVYIDLKQSVDRIWEDQIHSKHRNAIRKAEVSSLKFEIDLSFKNLDKFIELYEGTMTALGADSFYYFDKSYYENLIHKLGDNAFLGVVKKDSQIISSAIFFRYGLYGHYHLAGSDVESLALCPNNYLIYSVMKYLREQGVKLFHLGGGTSSDSDNGLYKFKKRFSTNEKNFYIGKVVFDQDMYLKLCKDWQLLHPEKKQLRNLLLCYRY